MSPRRRACSALLGGVLAVATAGCGERPAPVAPPGGGARVAVPAFTVRVRLTPDATARLGQAGERVRVHVWLDGEGTPLEGADTKNFRAVYLGAFERELTPPDSDVRFEGLTVAAEDMARLSGSYLVNVNVFSARRALPLNLLDCGWREVPIRTATAAPIEIACDALGR